jgi:molybdenum cofactor cytidylyltransferase
VIDLKADAVVLAAGKSERMGRNKLLLKVDNMPILDIVLSALNRSPVIGEIFVVLGHKPMELLPTVEARGTQPVFNPEYEEGMTSSFKAGLRQVSAEASFLVLGDQLGMDSELLDRMVALMYSDQGALLVSPVFEARRGHPVLFRRALFPEILNLSRQETLKDIVSRHESSHRFVEGDFWCVTDIDTPEDFDKAKKLFEANRRALS